MDVDAHGLRRKTYEKCILESYAVPYGDSSRIRGPATTLHSMNYFLENGGDPRLWLEVFRGSKNIARTDRVWHELTVLVDMFWYGAMVDQLNLPGLVCFEVLSRRLLAIIEAYSDPSRVNWASSKFYTGAAGLDDAAPAEMRSYVSRAAREMQDLEATRHRAQGPGGKSGGGGNDGDDEGGAPSGDKGGKAKGGRGSRKTRTPPALSLELNSGLGTWPPSAVTGLAARTIGRAAAPLEFFRCRFLRSMRALGGSAPSELPCAVFAAWPTPRSAL